MSSVNTRQTNNSNPRRTKKNDALRWSDELYRHSWLRSAILERSIAMNRGSPRRAIFSSRHAHFECTGSHRRDHEVYLSTRLRNTGGLFLSLSLSRTRAQASERVLHPRKTCFSLYIIASRSFAHAHARARALFTVFDRSASGRFFDFSSRAFQRILR